MITEWHGDTIATVNICHTFCKKFPLSSEMFEFHASSLLLQCTQHAQLYFIALPTHWWKTVKCTSHSLIFTMKDCHEVALYAHLNLKDQFRFSVCDLYNFVGIHGTCSQVTGFFFLWIFLFYKLTVLVYLSHYLMISCDSLSSHFLCPWFYLCLMLFIPPGEFTALWSITRGEKASYHYIYHPGSAPFTVTVKCIYSESLSFKAT